MNWLYYLTHEKPLNFSKEIFQESKSSLKITNKRKI